MVFTILTSAVTSKEGRIRISPELPAEQFGSCSVDFRLGADFSFIWHSRDVFIEVGEKGAIQELMRTIQVQPGEASILRPREFALVITEKTLELNDDILGPLECRSSLGRIGIIVHVTAGLFDPGWRGKATLELSNLAIMPVALYPACTSVRLHLNSSRRAFPFRITRRPETNTPGKTHPLLARTSD